MIVRGSLLLGFLLLPPIQAGCRSTCDSQIFTCSVTRVTRRECGDVENAPVTTYTDHSISTESHRRHTQISWTPREFEGLLFLPGHRKCYKIYITKTREGVATGRLGVRCVARRGPLLLYDVQAHTTFRISTSTGSQCRCVTPRRLETTSPGGGRLTVKWGGYEGTGQLNVSIHRLPDRNLVTSSILAITSRGRHPAKGEIHFDSFSLAPGQYVAVIRQVGCPSDCNRESATFEWPPSKEVLRTSASIRRYRHTCTCWTPDIVLIRVSNASVGEVEVEWTGNYSDSDLKVGVVRAGENSVFASSKSLKAFQLKSMKKNSVRFILSSKVPEEYTALVGSTGCASCMRYRESQSFIWPPPHPSSSEAPPSSTAPSRSGHSIKTLTAVFVVTGVLAFIMVVAVGVIISKNAFCPNRARKCRSKPVTGPGMSRDQTNETLLPPDPPGLQSVRFPLVVYQPSTEELHNAAERLANSMVQVGLSTRIHSLQDELKSGADLIMHITPREEMERIPAQLKTLQNRMVTVGVNLVKGSLSPSVSVPRNFLYNDVPNDLASLEDFLKLFRDPVTVKTLVVCSGENDRQLAICKLLVSLLDQPPLQLVFPDHTQCRNELKENTDEWFDRQVREARFILAIVPKEMDSEETSSNMTRFLNMVLDKARVSQTVLKKIVLVFLGDHYNKMTVQRPYLSTCPRFDLSWNSDETRPLLLRLVEHLCGGTDILHQACCRSDAERICGWQQDSELRVALRTLCTGEAEESL